MSVKPLLFAFLLIGCSRANATLAAFTTLGSVYPQYLYSATEVIDAGLQTGPIYTRGCGHLLIIATNNQAVLSGSVSYDFVDRADAGHPVAAATVASSGISIVSWGVDFSASTNGEWTAAGSTLSASINVPVPEFISVTVPIVSKDSLRIDIMCGP